MSTLRHQNEQSLEDQSIDPSESYIGSSGQQKIGKASGRLGRPRSKGRPKRSSMTINKKKNEEEQEWEDRARIRQRATLGKQQSSIEGYIRIIDYLKKIDYDEGNIQNKMNPYNALTATCFWYAISAQYFSHDFFAKKNPHDSAMEILDKMQRLPLLLPNRASKTTHSPSLLSFQTEALNALGRQMSDKISHLIPAPLSSRSQTIERKIPVSSISEDDLFTSSTRAIVYNYLNKKIKNSEKWSGLISNYSKNLQGLPTKQYEMPEPIEEEKPEEPYQQTNLFELLRQQARKKIQKKDKKKQQNQNEIFHQDSKEEIGSKKEQDLQMIKEPMKQEEEAQNQKESQIKNKIGSQIEQRIEQIQQGNHPRNIPEDLEVNNNYQQIQPQNQKQIEIEEKIQLELQQEQLKQEHQEKIEVQQIRQNYQKHYNQQDLMIDSIIHMPIDKIISILQSSIPTIQLPEIVQPLMPIPTKDPLQFIFQLHKDEQRYLQYRKQHRKRLYRQKIALNQNTLEDEERQGQYEDAKCQICTDGDYTDDNLIVFCSMCNISLHQRCVGLAKVPAQSWICDICVAFGPSGANLPCPLCNVKGGAMKRTTIHIDTNIFKQTNPGYFQYSKKCPYNKQKEEYTIKKKIQEEEQPIDEIKIQRQKIQKQQQFFYDYFVKSTYPEQIPVCHYVWVHYVCAIWVPECYFEQKNGMISIKGIQNIQKKRFKNECFVCKKNKCGAAVKCEEAQCAKYYHPECARKKKVYMQQLNLEKLKYLIFCQQHEPLKLTRQIEYKKKKSREQIIKFARMIEKYIQTYRIAQFPFKLMKSAITSNFIQTVARNQKIEQKDRRIPGINSDEHFMKQIMVSLSKAKMMTVHLDKVETGYKINSIETPSKRQVRKCLNRYDQFWHSIKNGESNEENFKRYERIIMENHKLRERLQIFLNGNLSIRAKQQEKKQKKIGRKRGKHAVQQVQTLIQQQGGIFCVCKKPYEGQTDMFQCQVCGQWYHFKCLSFIGNQQDAQNMQFKCMKCMKFEQGVKKEERLAKYSGLFAEDSIIYVYRPPTPDLLSEQQVEQKNYPAILQQARNMQQLQRTPSRVKKESSLVQKSPERLKQKQKQKEQRNKLIKFSSMEVEVSNPIQRREMQPSMQNEQMEQQIIQNNQGNEQGEGNQKKQSLDQDEQRKE